MDKQLRTVADKMAVPLERVAAIAVDHPDAKARRAYNAVVAMNRFTAAGRHAAVSPSGLTRHQSEPIPVAPSI